MTHSVVALARHFAIASKLERIGLFLAEFFCSSHALSLEHEVQSNLRTLLQWSFTRR